MLVDDVHRVCTKCSLEKAQFWPPRSLSKCASYAFFFLQGVLSSPFSFMMKFGKSVVHVFLNDIAQKNLLFALIDEHRVHLPVYHQQTHLHSVPACPNSMWLG